jgi:hypothetical protein
MHLNSLSRLSERLNNMYASDVEKVARFEGSYRYDGGGVVING